MVEDTVKHELVSLAQFFNILPGSQIRVYPPEIHHRKAAIGGVGEKWEDVQDAEKRFLPALNKKEIM